LTQADLIYLLTNAKPEHVVRTKTLMRQVQLSVSAPEPNVKVVLNQVPPPPHRASVLQILFSPTERVNPSDVAEQLGHPIDFTLPRVLSSSGELTVDDLGQVLKDPSAPYALGMRRIARALGGRTIGLALGSGAALGLAHIGVLKVFEREQIPVDIVAGSSVGALIGGLWATGVSAEELEQMAVRFKNPWDVRRLFVLDLGIPAISLPVGALAGVLLGWLAGFWAGLFFGCVVTVTVGVVLGPLAGGPIQGAKLMAKLEEDFRGKTFEETRVPLLVVAANPMTRGEVIFDSGSIAQAVRASVSIPGIFKPVIHRGRVCLDGGVVNPVPVSVLKRAGAKHVIAVNVFPTSEELRADVEQQRLRREDHDALLASRSFPIRLSAWLRQEWTRSTSPLVFEVIMRSLQSMEFQIAEVACAEADLTLRPTVPGSHWLEFFSPEKFIRRGEEVALEHLPELRRLAGAQKLTGVDNA
jgi:NTE family protein